MASEQQALVERFPGLSAEQSVELVAQQMARHMSEVRRALDHFRSEIRVEVAQLVMREAAISRRRQERLEGLVAERLSAFESEVLAPLNG